MKIQVKTEGLKDEALAFAESINAAFKDIPEGITKAELTEALEKFKTDNPIPAAVKADVTKAMFDEMQETVNQIKEQGTQSVTPIVNIAKEWKDNKDAIKGLANRTTGKEVVIKTATTRASVATPNVGGNIPGIGQLGYIKRSFYDVCSKVSIPSNNNDTGVIPYTDWDESTVVRAAAAVAENTAFPESTAAFKGYTLPIQKIGDTLPVSEEFFEDENLAAAELKMFLEINVNTNIDWELINGDNTGSHLKGLISSTPAYVLPTVGSVVTPNIYDLITKVVTDITLTRGSKYDPNMAVMNKNTADRLLLSKNGFGDYQFPPNHPIFSMIIVDNNMPDNQMVVGDSRYAKIYEKIGVILSQGVVSTQFTSDMMTLKARTRLAFLIRTVDQTGFRKVLDITAALTAITIV